MQFACLPVLGLFLLGVAAAPSTMPDATRLTDFDDADANARWEMTNDNVMGGQSDGDVRFEDGTMTFFGDINTDGGGFSSVRLPIEQGTLEGVNSIVLRVKPDDRGPYRLIVTDTAGRGRDGPHRADLEFPQPAGEWQIVTVNLNALTPTFHGEPVDASPLDPAKAVQIGFILNDTGDGPFALQIDWIDLAR